MASLRPRLACNGFTNLLGNIFLAPGGAAGTYGLPVRAQNLSIASASDDTGCLPAIWAARVALRALNLF